MTTTITGPVPRSPTEVEDHLVARLTDLLLTHEGVNPTNARARELAWVWVHRPA
jgi:hypothetical protein